MPGEYSQQALHDHFDSIAERLRAIEAQLKVLSDHAGVSYEERNADVPQEVVQLAAEGKTLEAATAYREATGADIKEAMKVVAGI